MLTSVKDSKFLQNINLITNQYLKQIRNKDLINPDPTKKYYDVNMVNRNLLRKKYAFMAE